MNQPYDLLACRIAAAAVLFLGGIIVGEFLQRWIWRKKAPCACRIASAALDEEGWVLLDADGDILPWPENWPDNVDSSFFARRGWKRQNLGTLEEPKEGWIAP